MAYNNKSIGRFRCNIDKARLAFCPGNILVGTRTPPRISASSFDLVPKANGS